MSDEMEALHAEVARLRVEFETLKSFHNGFVQGAESRITALIKERDHWQANHADMTRRAAVLSNRPDLPVDRLPAIARYEERIARLEAQIVELSTSPK